MKRERELKKGEETIKSRPVFEINKIPHEIILKCAELMYTDEYAKNAVKDPVLFKTEVEPFIFLGWLYHNDLMKRDDNTMLEPLEGIAFNYDDYELEDGGYNLDVTIDNMDIDNMKPYLKGLLLNNQE